MFEAVIQFSVSAGVLLVAGYFLTRTSDRIAELTGVGRLLVGSILLAGATALPELFVDISALRKGMPDLAVGDLMGSSLANLMILAIADLMHRGTGGIFSQKTAAANSLSAALSIAMTTLAGCAIFLGPRLAGFDLGPIGIGPLALGIAYLLGMRLVYFGQKTSSDPARSAEVRKRPLTIAFSIYFACALVILIAAPFVAESAGKIAEMSGLGETFIGTTLVALCTSLPELISTITAVRMGSFSLAVGNIFGSNSFNMLLLLPLDVVHEGSLLAAVSRSHLLSALFVILATSVAVMGQLYPVEKRRKRIEPDALAVMGTVLGALVLLYFFGTG